MYNTIVICVCDNFSRWGNLLSRVSGVELGEHVGRNSLQHLLGEDTQQLPANVQRLEDGTVLVVALGDEVLLELAEELEVEQVVGGERLLADHSLHGLHVLADGVARVQLIGHVRVVLPGHVLTDGRLHQTRQRWQHVHWWVDLPVVQLPVNVDLTLGDVTGQIGDWMGDVVVGHGQNGNLSDGTVAALDSASALVDGGQIGVHVTGETTSAGHLLAGGGHLTQGLGVRAHVGQDDQHVLLALVGEELGCGQRQAGRDDALDGRIVGQVQEQAHVLHGTVFLESKLIGQILSMMILHCRIYLKILFEESGGFHVDTHGGKHDGKVVLVRVHH
jgi:hypothetical protein